MGSSQEYDLRVESKGSGEPGPLASDSQTAPTGICALPPAEAQTMASLRKARSGIMACWELEMLAHPPLDILVRGQRGEQGAVLEQDAPTALDVEAILLRQGLDVAAEKLDLARFGLD